MDSLWRDTSSMMRPKENQTAAKATEVKSLAMATVFSSLWIAGQLVLSPIVGRLSLGPLNLHGVVERVLGWFLMATMTWLTARFGRITLMASVAAIGTRLFRAPSFESITVGAGYALGGLVFDLLYFQTRAHRLRSQSVYGFWIVLFSAMSASTPYLLWKLSTLGLPAFLLLSPLYALDVAKGLAFSSIGATLGLRGKSGPVLKSLFKVTGGG